MRERSQVSRSEHEREGAPREEHPPPDDRSETVERTYLKRKRTEKMKYKVLASGRCIFRIYESRTCSVFPERPPERYLNIFKVTENSSLLIRLS